MSAERIEPRSWIRAPWFTWSWLIVLVIVVVQSVNYHWRILPTTGPGYFARGRTDYIQGDYEEAIVNLTKSIERQPNEPEGYIWRGEAFAKLREFDQAKPDLAKALQLAPDYAKSHAAMADYHAQVWDRDRAIDEFSTAVTLDPTYARCYLERAQLLFDAGRWDDAAADLREGTKLLTEDRQVTAYLLLWLARARSGDATGATSELSDLLASRRLDVRRFWAGAKFFGGELTEARFIAVMKELEGGDEGELTAEALFFAGGKRLAFGDRSGGLALMRGAVRTGAEESFAYERARVELETSLLGFHPMRTDDNRLVIASVTPGGPAAAAGIQPGSTLAAIDDRPATREAFLELLSKVEPGMTVQLQIVEGGGPPRMVRLPLAITLDSFAPTK